MATTSLVPVVVSAKLNKIFQEQSMARNITTNEWEGEVMDEGASVKIQSFAASTVKNYAGSVSYEGATSSSVTLTINVSKYFATEVTKVEQKQAKKGIDIMNGIVTRTMPNVMLEADKAVMALHSGITTNGHGSTTTPIAVNSANIVDEFVRFNTVMDRENVNPEDRFMVLPPELYAKITLAGITLDTDNSEVLSNNWKGKFLGVDVWVSNQVVEDGTGKYKCIGGSYSGIAFAQQIMDVEYFEKLEGKFASAVRGLSVFGTDIINEDKLYLLTATAAAEA